MAINIRDGKIDEVNKLLIEIVKILKDTNRPLKKNIFYLDDDSWIEMGNLPDGLKNTDFDTLWSVHPDNYNQIKIYNKLVDMPRYTETYLKNYIYSNVEHKAKPLPQEFKPFFECANKLDSTVDYNQVLVNWYENGNHYISAHCDDEKQLIDEHPIISISLGAERVFRIRDKETKKIVKDIVMKDGTYLIMGGKMQHRFTHEVPKITGNVGEKTGKRINITFRKFK
jgi:alkylated DNA repair dioxygenase AlkB